MINNPYFLMIFLLFFNSCNTKDEFFLKGTISSYYNGKYIKLITYSQNEIRNIDSVMIDNGNFFFRGNAYVDRFSILQLGDETDPEESVKLFLEPGTIDVYFDSESVIFGTPFNDIYQLTIERDCKLDKINQEIEAAQLQNKPIEELELKWYKTRDQYLSDVEIIKANIDNPLGKEMFREICVGMWYEDFLDIYSMADDDFKSESLIAECFKNMSLRHKRQEQKEELRGTTMVDFLLYTPEGEEKKMSDYWENSEYVLFDFWASWCGPCIDDFQYIRKIYTQYKDKVKVVGISLDANEEAWMNAIKTHNVFWPQLNGMKDELELRETYAIAGIPHTILVDPKGTIVEIGYPARIILQYVLEDLFD